jgi:hypothetical protein
MQENKEIKKEIEYHPIFPGNKYQKPEATALYIPVWIVGAILVMCLIILKKFIYTKDEKRDGQ